MRNKIWMVLSVLLGVALIMAACQPAAPTPQVVVETVVVEGTPKVVVVTPQATQPAEQRKVLRLAWGPGDIPTIDTALAVDVISIQLIDEMTVGLTRQNEQTAELELAMATDVQTSEDGRTYTFTIKEGVPWVRYNGKEVEQVLDCDGNPRYVTAYDFEYGILRTLNPATASDYAYVLYGIEGAAAYNQGETDDPSTVGVKALDAKTLQITFIEPAVYNLNIAGLWVAHAQPKWIIEGDDCTEGRGERWTETGFYQGYGPFTLKEWVHDSEISIVKNPFWPGDAVVPSPKIDEVHWKLVDAAGALAEFETGNLDVSGIPAGDLDRILNDPKYADMLRNTYTLGTEFYAFNTTKAPTDDVRVRLALALAVDREALVKNVTKTGVPARWFTHPGVAGAPKPEKFPNLGLTYDPQRAKTLLDEYLKEKGLTADQLDLTLVFNTSESHRRKAEAVQAMWKETLGINVKLTNQEWKVYLKQRKAGNENIYRGSWVQDYPDANNFLREVFTDNNGTPGPYQDVVNWPVAENAEGKIVYTPGSNPLYDKFVELVIAAAKETDSDKRMQLYADAENILVNEAVVILPLYWYADKVLVSPRVIDTPSITGYDRFEKWDIKS
ncbi:peptide ABC transporter substrate-binding protein [uncultured Thermanaerothrix sp.]|uniref:peptide ABC transporter substrate-binding protein n=1 Tax=uncultured Thermanaerothrix sp. TaxID=1195149 RepID=UPI00261FB89D|nr:peptide ABC transporter substrate-binding protein [uncultured Thermanaerothrix sp.]